MAMEMNNKIKEKAKIYTEDILGLDYIGMAECERAYIAGYEQACKDLNVVWANYYLAETNETIVTNMNGKNNIKYINKYIVTEDDLKCDIANFPVEIVQAMVDYQAKYHNKPDPSVFARNLYATIDSGGFDWDETTEGYEFWEDVIVNKNFNRFFEYTL